jgi:hypothetical protein
LTRFAASSRSVLPILLILRNHPPYRRTHSPLPLLSFRTIESNLDAKICTPQYSRAELTKFVHRPLFKHAAYFSSSSPVSTINLDPPFSTNLASLRTVIQSLDIEQDPKVVSLRRQLARAGAACGSFRFTSFLLRSLSFVHLTSRSSSLQSPIPSFIGAGTAAERLSPEYVRLDGQLSKTLSKQSTFTHKGLKDLERAAIDILYSIGPWACDWFVWSVVEHAKKASGEFLLVLGLSFYLGRLFGRSFV